MDQNENFVEEVVSDVEVAPYIDNQSPISRSPSPSMIRPSKKRKIALTQKEAVAQSIESHLQQMATVMTTLHPAQKTATSCFAEYITTTMETSGISSEEMIDLQANCVMFRSMQNCVLHMF